MKPWPTGKPEISRRLDARIAAVEDELRKITNLLHRKKGPRCYWEVWSPLAVAYGRVQTARRAAVVPLFQEGGRP